MLNPMIESRLRRGIGTTLAGGLPSAEVASPATMSVMYISPWGRGFNIFSPRASTSALKRYVPSLSKVTPRLTAAAESQRPPTRRKPALGGRLFSSFFAWMRSTRPIVRQTRPRNFAQSDSDPSCLRHFSLTGRKAISPELLRHDWAMPANSSAARRSRSSTIASASPRALTSTRPRPHGSGLFDTTMAASASACRNPDRSSPTAS